MVKITKTKNDDILEKEVIEISLSDWYRYKKEEKGELFYKNEFIFSYEICDKYIKPVKVEVKRESVQEFMARKKDVNCAYSNCTNSGYHLGNYCGKHYGKAWEYMRKNKITFNEFVERVAKAKEKAKGEKENEKN